ncbi:MAG TPA: ankyrin repeat domain-containing protein, partial [Candidatus Binataceae bacterium]|nr:ankyrin repeat domain-containing protein [Candidatus Binataceae bacterium]
KNKDGNTALHLAACEGGESTVKLLLAKGANVSAQNSSRDTPLDLARRKCHGAIVELLEKK